jgi:predicted nucleic acid-binding protein
MLVVDASVAVKWFIAEPGEREAVALLDRREPLIAPELVVAELVNVAWKRLVAGTIDEDQAADVPRGIRRFFTQIRPMTPLAPRALAIAAELRHPAYDCFYLALAEAEDAPLVTTDRRLLRRVEGTAFAERVQGLGH